MTRSAATESPRLKRTRYPSSSFSTDADIGVHAEIDAAIAHGLGEPVAQIHVEVPQDLVAAIKHGHRDSEAVEDRGELHADIAGADDDDAAGKLLELEAFVRADQMLLARKVRDHWMAAGRNENGLGRERAVAVGELHLMRRIERRRG